MEVFIDTEFTGLVPGTELISIGMVAEDGRTFYAEFNDFDRGKIDSWLQENVIDNLIFNNEFHLKTYPNGSMELCNDSSEISKAMTAWFQSLAVNGDKIEIWSNCLAYDWVLFTSLFEGAFSVPSCVYYIPFDICTVFKMKGIDPDINREEFAGDLISGIECKKHNSLYDAYVIRACYERLQIVENPYLPKEYIEKLTKLYPPEWIKRHINRE